MKNLSFHFLPLALVSYATYTINQSYQCQQHTKFCFDDTYSDKNSLNDLTTIHAHLRLKHAILHWGRLLLNVTIILDARHGKNFRCLPGLFAIFHWFRPIS